MPFQDCNMQKHFHALGIPWPLGAFDNRRSFTSIDNLCFVIDRLISENSIAYAQNKVQIFA